MTKKKEPSKINKEIPQLKYQRPNPIDRFTFETTHSYWVEIANNLEEHADQLEKEVNIIKEHLPDSVSYWTINSRFQDAQSVAKVVRAFVDSQWYKK